MMDEETLSQAWGQISRQARQTSPFLADLWPQHLVPWNCVTDPQVLLLPDWLGTFFLPRLEPGFGEALREANLLLAAGVAVAGMGEAGSGVLEGLKAAALWDYLFSQARHRLFAFLPPASIFWRYFRLYVEDFFMGLLWEAEQDWQAPAQFGPDSFLFMGQRLSLLKIPGAALAVKAGREPDLETLSRAVDRLGTALVLEKNLIEWRQDLAAGRTTWVTASLRPQGVAANGNGRPSTGQVSVLHSQDGIARGWALCAQYYDDALGRISGWPPSQLHDLIDSHRQRAKSQEALLSSLW